MRTITTAQQNVRASGNQAEHVQVLIDNGTSGLVDVATLASPGTFDPVKSVNIRESIDDPMAVLTVVLHREMFKWSVSPYVDSGLNRIGASGKPGPGNALKPLLQLGNRVMVKAAVVAMDRQPSAGDYMTVFDGRIDKLDAARDRDVQIDARLAPSGRLAQQFIRRELVYAYVDDGGPVSARIWEPDSDFAPGTNVIPATRGSADSGFNKFFATTAGGHSGTAEPTWPSSGSVSDNTITWDFGGAPTTSGFAVEDVMNAILSDNLGTGDALFQILTPVSPGWQIRQFIQQRSFTLDAVKALAQQIGWDLRPKWDSGSSFFQLTFYQPDRSSPTVVQTFQASDYKDPSSLGVDISEIRNFVRVVYADHADLWPDGTPKRKVVEVSDSSSIAKYGELWMEIQEDENSNIDSSTEATALANAALSDLKEPTAQMSVQLVQGFPWVELNDYYTFKANGIHFDADESLAVVGYSHAYEASSGGKACWRTTLEVRGKPTVGVAAYEGMSCHPSQAVTQAQTQAGAHQMVQFQGPQTPVATMTNTVGGTRVSLAVDVDKRALESEYEVHVYPTAATALDSTTLKATTKARTVELSDLIPGKTYYARVVPRHYNRSRLVRGQPSKEVSFVAGQASAGHLSDGIALGDYPLNGGFETRSDVAGMPDHWSIEPSFGTFGTDVQVMEDGNGISGGRYLRLVGKATGNVNVDSGFIPVINEAGEAHRFSQIYRFSVWTKAATANSIAGALEVEITMYDYAGGVISSTSAITVIANVTKGHWIKTDKYVRVDATTAVRSGRISLIANATGSSGYTIDVDEVRLQWIGTPWYNVGDTANFTENYDSIPSFDNTYAAHADAAPSFRKDQFGAVEMKGAFKHATTTKVGFSLVTLPAPFWPLEKKVFIVSANGQDGLLEVSTSGVVTLVSAANANPSTKISVDGVTWRTFA